jgi:cell surface protein SprA
LKTLPHYQNHKTLKTSLLLLFFLIVNNIFSQVTPPDSLGYNKGKVELKTPPSISELYTYDPATNKYIFNTKLGEFNIKYPVILTQKEYLELVQREKIRKYFRDKADAIDGKKLGSEQKRRDLLPKFYVNNSFFETIFGSNTIEVKPTGTVEMDLGIRYTKQDNPAFSPRNRVNTAFDFNQRINLSLMGKVGTRLNVNANYDTQSTFAFQNLIKLEFAPQEDNILQKLEVGNVSMPLNSTLIKGAQSLFGVKAQLQFGRTTITGVFSEQKSESRAVIAQGGGTVQEFDIFGLDYDADRHFFLSQYFRNKYDNSLKNYPLIDSQVQITRIEVWVTNRLNRVNTTENNLRNIIALQDLGEAQQTGFADSDIVNLNNTANFFIPSSNPNLPADNKNNRYDPALIGTPNGYLNSTIREIVTTSNNSFTLPVGAVVSEGQDYSKLENARKLTASEFTYHPQLGYISLQQRLANDEVLAVAYQYSEGNKIYQVGEFGNGGVDNTIVTPGATPQNQTVVTQSLILKMLKSSLTTVTNPTTQKNTPVWNLMMKNIYQIAPGGQLEQEDFRFNILYSDPSPLNYITAVNASSPLPANVEKTALLKVFNVDKLNFTNDPQQGGDGFFDFIPGLTVDTQFGRIIFTTVEPFGKHLFKKLSTSTLEDYNDPTSYNANQAKYVFRNMYRNTQAGALQSSEKNKFQLRGRYKSTAGDGIAIGAFNVPRGSVKVTVGGRVLQEGIDYSVNYQAGRVQILDPAIKASNQPIQISVENNAVFGQQTRRFYGINIEHKFSDKFIIGGTLLKLSERPFTQKSVYGQESVNNTIFGFNTNYSSEVPFLTRMANKLPNIDTDVPSNISFRGEVAFLKPDSPDADKFEGESTIYVDDFEGSQTTIDMRAAQAWSLSSIPLWKSGQSYNTFGLSDGLDPPPSLSDGFKRAKLAWHTIDPTFYTSSKPASISDAEMAVDNVRRVFITELFPNTDIAAGQPTVINTFDLSYYPGERGPYNFNSAANGNALPNPTSNFGGIMRAINSTNFEQANVEYIQFWMLDPYYNNQVSQANIGKVYFNLGQISEDVLRDGRKQYENGLPDASGTQNTISTIWGKTPVSQSLIYAFDTNDANRNVQDIGLDGANDVLEASIFPPAFAGLPDPAGDNYRFYLDVEGNVIQRYKNYNGLEKNSPVNVTDNTRGNNTAPDVEDINRDNTMNTINAYYQYNVDIGPNLNVGQNYVTDIRETTATNPTGGDDIKSRWIQFKIPIDQGTGTTKFGNIEDFRSIQFMRMFMTGFSEDITLRFGTLDLVRGEWRRYTQSLAPSTIPFPSSDVGFDVLAVNIIENANRVPIKYIAPPGVVREQLVNNNTVINQNEQSLALRISKDGLEPGDSRAVFKNVSVDMRQFNNLKMFLHAEALEDDLDGSRLQDNEMSGFIRFGNDFTQNYYQVERPMKTTLWGDSSTSSKIWPEENNINLSMALLTRIKIIASQNPALLDADGVYSKFDYEIDPSIQQGNNNLRISVKGNPNFGLVRVLMVGVKNNTLTGKTPNGTALTPRKIKGEAWFNELRLAGMDNKGGMAAVASFDSNIADLATISATGRMSTIGFGALEDGPNQRSRKDAIQYNIVTNLNVGKLLPKKWGINLPFNYAVGEEIITPEYDPFNQDIRLKDLLAVTNDEATRNNLKSRAQEYTKNTSINFIGVKKERSAEQKPHIYDPENLTLSYSFNETTKHDYEIESFIDQRQRTSVDYAYSFNAKPVEPFKKVKAFQKSSYWKLLSDFNFNFLPSNINFSTTFLRQFNRQQFRQVDVQGLGLDPLYRRNYQFNYQYGFNYNLTKALKINYTAASNNIVRSYIDENGNINNNLNIWDDYWNIGETNQHNQQITVNYDLPINKIPFLSFVKSSYTYQSDYNWQRASVALSQYTDENGTTFNLGNTVQNNASHRLNNTFNMDQLYKYIGLVKSSNRTPKTQAPKPTTPPKPGEKIKNTRVQTSAQGNVFVDGLIGVLTSVKNVQVNYTQTGGTVLPGYTPGLGFFGTSKPTLGFVFGSQADIRQIAAENGYLTNYDKFNQNFTQVSTKKLEMTANVDLFPDFKIDLTATRNETQNFSEQYIVENGRYQPLSPYSFGNYNTSTILLATAFGTSDETTSAAFDAFRNNRIIIANRLATERGIDLNNPINIGPDGFPIGYGKNSQAVLLPAFLAAYTGQSAGGVSLGALRNLPLPNWNIKYGGLMRYKFFKDNFKRFSIQHGYRASYTINSIRSNFEYDKNPNGFDAGGNFNNKDIISNVNLVEQFNPLVKLDFQLQNSLSLVGEVKKDRSLSMSFDNNLLTEVKGMDYVFGLGYRIKDVSFNSVMADNPNGIIKSDINIRLDFTYRNAQTIVRYLDYNNNQLAGGQDLWSARINADYSFSKNLTAIFYYDHTFTKAVISTSFPITTIRAGFTIRYNFGN